jgi:RNA polymerase sigma factor (TIGR02999 family)
VAFADRARFMAYASRVMRGLIVDQARSGRAAKRGGQLEITSLNAELAAQVVDGKALSAISDVLDELAQEEPSLAEIVDMKFFCGFTLAEIAAMQGTAERTVQRKWEKARLYLHQRLQTTVPV